MSISERNVRVRTLFFFLVCFLVVAFSAVFAFTDVRINDSLRFPRDTSVVGSWGHLDDGQMVDGQPGITFMENGVVKGYDGFDCNGFSGKWSLDSEGFITTRDLHSTLAGCENSNEGSPWFEDWAGFQVSDRGHQLIVFDEGGDELGRLWRQ